jgi:choline dehydrogenase-like flavoprotein
MPPLQSFAQGALIARGFAKLGLRTSPLPMAINSVEYKGRAACVYDGWCDAGCPIYALANPLTIYLPQALKAGAAILHNSFVTRVLTRTAGDRATGVEYFDADGRRQVQEASVVVLAAYAFQIPRLLLNSRPGGLANSSGLVGRYMMAHAGGNVFGLFKEDTQNYLGMTGGQLLSQENYAKDPAKGFLSASQWMIGNALKPNDLLGIVNARPDLFGSELHDFLRTAGKHLATMTFLGEALPNPDNRMVLAGGKDKYGFPLARVTHDFGPDDIKSFEAGMKQGQEIFKAAGAYEVWAGRRVQIHTMGGAIMGRRPETSVTNPYGQTHDVSNLFVAGSSLFPTSAGVNPTFTIHALALRSAEYLIQNWSNLV